MVILLRPAVSPVSASVTSTSQPRDSAQRVYMRESISAQSCASVPPAPALMLRMQFFRSCGPFRKTFSSSESSSLKYLARSPVSSCSICACAAGGSASPSSSMTRKSSSCFSDLASGSILARIEFASSIRPCAFSRLFQKLSAAISALISASRFCNAATSKKPPQVRKFVSGGGYLRLDGVEHIRQKLAERFIRIQNGFLRQPLNPGEFPPALRFLRPLPKFVGDEQQQEQPKQQIAPNNEPLQKSGELAVKRRHKSIGIVGYNRSLVRSGRDISNCGGRILRVNRSWVCLAKVIPAPESSA